jgi:hypothetical protein
MRILAELDTQRKALLKKGEEVPSHMVEPSFEELMAGRVQPSPHETPKEKEKHISAFRFMVWSSWPPRFALQKDGRWTCAPSHYSRQIPQHQMKP